MALPGGGFIDSEALEGSPVGGPPRIGDAGADEMPNADLAHGSMAGNLGDGQHLGQREQPTSISRLNPLCGRAQMTSTVLTAPEGVMMRGTQALIVVLCSKKRRCCQLRRRV